MVLAHEGDDHDHARTRDVELFNLILFCLQVFENFTFHAPLQCSFIYFLAVQVECQTYIPLPEFFCRNITKLNLFFCFCFIVVLVAVLVLVCCLLAFFLSFYWGVREV